MQPQDQPLVNQLIDHLFRHESGKMVASFTRLFGPHHLELIEDAVQEALLKAVRQWPFTGIPENPRAWLWQVAKNQTIDLLRRETSLSDKLAEIARKFDDYISLPEPQLSHEVQDNQLRLMFTCCHPLIPREAQVALTLKTLCGFSIPEISRAFLVNEATMAKRLVRAKQKLKQPEISYEVPTGETLSNRLTSVLEVLYLLFNEGYYASHGDELIRWDLCGEAIRLTTLLTEHPVCARPETHALLALMLLHSARLGTRQDEQGNLLLLSEQDRSRWDKEKIIKGFHHLHQASKAEVLNEYYLQALIAACHCIANSDETTDWAKILRLYDLLGQLNDSPVIALNRAVALSKVHGPEAGIQAINEIETSKAMKAYPFLYATRAALHRQLADYEKACDDYQQALKLTKVKAAQSFLRAKFKACQEKLASK